ncbi:MAG TPA: oxidoreductase [Caulobacteraceae bacterium]|jgi:NAD(P)-dependent dehydrogenase (short-subunit alcohol dehydrogenase family)|nr:oxidoreductase [Caulobacteraceae bacterium]
MTTWLITGCSSGFGRILSEAVLARGDNAIVTARNRESVQALADRYPGRASAAALDVTRAGDAAAAVDQAVARFGRLDVLVNNAGFGFIGAVEESEAAEYRPMFETNLFGLIETTRAALPVLRRSGGGRIVNFSSVGGITGRMGFGLYNASKFAVEGLSEALAEEVAPFGIKVLIVEPGAFRTDFLGRSILSAQRRLEAYEATSGRTRDFSHANDGRQLGDPEQGVVVLLQAVDSPTPPLRLPLGKDAYGRIRSKIGQLEQDLCAWEDLATATGFA